MLDGGHGRATEVNSIMGSLGESALTVWGNNRVAWLPVACLDCPDEVTSPDLVKVTGHQR